MGDIMELMVLYKNEPPINYMKGNKLLHHVRLINHYPVNNLLNFPLITVRISHGDMDNHGRRQTVNIMLYKL